MQQQLYSREVYVVVLAQPGLMDKYRDMKLALAKRLIGLGTTQIIVGIFCVTFQSVLTWIMVDTDSSFHGSVSFSFAGYGFWMGILVRNLDTIFIFALGLSLQKSESAIINVSSIGL